MIFQIPPAKGFKLRSINKSNGNKTAATHSSTHRGHTGHSASFRCVYPITVLKWLQKRFFGSFPRLLTWTPGLNLQGLQSCPGLLSFHSVLFLTLTVASVTGAMVTVLSPSKAKVKPWTLSLPPTNVSSSQTKLFPSKIGHFRAKLLLSHTQAAVVYRAPSQWLFHTFIFQNWLGP